MKLLRVCVVIILLFSGVGFIGCGGGGADIKTKSTTVGQELTDLDKAYKDGIITEKEYNKAKKDILKGK
ncbi:MAG: SHOCT domain-containing protein [Thermodesulfobacteriota bacterium]|nr:SHOCT domain-containing protein [Thermodesulfobacteriota bacterium]